MNIRLDYTLTFDEWTEAFDTGNRSITGRRGFIRVLLFSTFLLAALLGLLIMGHLPWAFSSVSWPVGGGLLIMMIVWIALRRKLRGLARVEWESNATLRGWSRTTIDESALAVVQEHRQATWKWPAFVKFDETPTMFLLYISHRAFLPIPRRAFSVSDLEEFSDFLIRRVPCANPRSAGFKVIPKPPPPSPLHVQPLESREFL